jgi:adenylate cyclase
LSYLNYVREELSRRQIRNTFSRYVSPTLVDQLSRQSKQLQLGGETKNMTILFCDIRNFTSISEQYQADPQGLTQLINRLLTPLTDSILDHKGTIDKYIGDCIMAFWNAPLDDPDHATNACKAALDILRKLDSFNHERRIEAGTADDSFFPIKVGIGINTGMCVVGNLGSEQRFDYSVLGDTVNIASRLEEQSKFYGLEIVIGPHTATLVGVDRLAILEIDLITLRGKREAARTYTVLGGPELHDDPNFQSLVESHSAMLEAFRSRQWLQVKALLVDCRNNPHAPLGLYARYDDCLAYYQKHPPPTEWLSIFDSTSK